MFVIILYFFNRLVAIWILVAAIVAYGLSFIPLMRKGRKGKYLAFFKKFNVIDGTTAARKLGVSLNHVERQLYRWAREFDGRHVVVFFKNEYYFIHGDVLDEYCEHYEQGYGEKELLDVLREYGVDTRDMVKAIGDKLADLNRLPERKVTVRERRERLRFQD
ncbi:MAG: hypothetical protein ACTSU5_18520 [Promethearchaeota archaeon]